MVTQAGIIVLTADCVRRGECLVFHFVIVSVAVTLLPVNLNSFKTRQCAPCAPWQPPGVLQVI